MLGQAKLTSPLVEQESFEKTIQTELFMTQLSFPFTEEKIRALKVGDEVLISGVVFTGRDAVHK